MDNNNNNNNQDPKRSPNTERQRTNNKKPAKQGQNNNGNPRTASRGAAIRAQKRASEDAHRIASQYLPAGDKNLPENTRRANFIDDSPRLKIIGLGGMDGAVPRTQY
jgi:hypothetical protein